VLHVADVARAGEVEPRPHPKHRQDRMRLHSHTDSRYILLQTCRGYYWTWIGPKALAKIFVLSSFFEEHHSNIARQQVPRPPQSRLTALYTCDPGPCTTYLAARLSVDEQARAAGSDHVDDGRERLHLERRARHNEEVALRKVLPGQQWISSIQPGASGTRMFCMRGARGFGLR
jgi:hypothetical protein